MYNIDAETPRWVAGWEALAESLAMATTCAFTNTRMMCRAASCFTKFADHHVVREYEDRIAIADRKLKSILKPTKCCIHGDYPESHFCSGHIRQAHRNSRAIFVRSVRI